MIRAKGFTLIELVIAMTIIAVGLIGTLLAINAATLFSGDPLINNQAISIAESYLEEMMTKDFPSPALAAPCPATGLTRANFTDICNYNGLNQVPTDQNGNAIAGLSRYTVQVSVDRQTAVLGSLGSGTEVVRMDVSVSHPSMTTFTLSAYRTNY